MKWLDRFCEKWLSGHCITCCYGGGSCLYCESNKQLAARHHILCNRAGVDITFCDVGNAYFLGAPQIDFAEKPSACEKCNLLFAEAKVLCDERLKEQKEKVP